MTIPSDTASGLASFYVPWAAALGASAFVPDAGGNYILIEFAGMEWPVLRLILAIAGVVLARPLAPRREPSPGLVKSISLTALMVFVACVWVIEARPGLLFTLVVAIGLGFSGYTLIELTGARVEAAARRVLEAAVKQSGGEPGSSSGDKSDGTT